MSDAIDERTQDIGPAGRQHTCFLSDEEKQTLKDLISILSQVKGNFIKGFALGLTLVFILGTVGALFGVKLLIEMLREGFR